jgi:hypothetical protein
MIVPKTPREIKLHNHYIKLIEMDYIITDEQIVKFKKDQDKARKENPIYNN